MKKEHKVQRQNIRKHQSSCETSGNISPAVIWECWWQIYPAALNSVEVFGVEELLQPPQSGRVARPPPSYHLGGVQGAATG